MSSEQISGGTERITNILGITSVLAPGERGMNLEYRGPNSYSIDYHGFGGPSFGPGDFAGSSSLFDIFRKFEQGYADNLELARKNVGIELTYATLGNWFSTIYPPSANSGVVTFFTAGSLTPYGHTPTTGSGSFAGIADGFWFDGTTWRRLHGSLATSTADFGTRDITLMLDLRGYVDAFGDFSTAPTTTFGTLNGMGTIAMSPSPYARGDFIATAGYFGQFSGRFYGPSANEFGVSFRLTGPANQSAFGVAVFKRD